MASRTKFRPLLLKKVMMERMFRTFRLEAAAMEEVTLKSRQFAVGEGREREREGGREGGKEGGREDRCETASSQTVTDETTNEA